MTTRDILSMKFFLFIFLALFGFSTASANNHSYTTIHIWNGVCNGLDRVTMRYYPVDSTVKDRGISVIVCPGGSYHYLGMKNEGSDVAEWLNGNGISCYVLAYRTAGYLACVLPYRRIFRGVRFPDMFQDVQRAIELVREREGSGRIVGVMGFSAGGHLSMSSAEYCNTDYLLPLGIRHGVSLRPDFVAPIYPVVTMTQERYVHKRSRRGLIGEGSGIKPAMLDSLSLERHVTPQCPPVFLLNCVDDPKVDYHNSVMLDSALVANNVKHTYIQYKKGGHGFGAYDPWATSETIHWKAEFIRWLDENFPNQ